MTRATSFKPRRMTCSARSATRTWPVLKPARLSGIRELYLTLTGDVDMHGGYYPERARLATTADFSGLVKNSLNKVIANRWQELGEAGYNWWQRIASVEHFDSLQQITGTLVGTVGDLPEVAERGEYQELVVGDSPETADWKKYGGYIPLTLELIDRDETRKLKAYPRELAVAGLRKISSLVSAVFTANSGIGPTLADTGALFNATAVTTAGGHKNLLTGALSCRRMGRGLHGSVQPADAHQEQRRGIRHRSAHGGQPALSAGSARAATGSHEDPVPVAGERRQYLQREHAARPAG